MSELVRGRHPIDPKFRRRPVNLTIPDSVREKAVKIAGDRGLSLSRLFEDLTLKEWEASDDLR